MYCTSLYFPAPGSDDNSSVNSDEDESMDAMINRLVRSQYMHTSICIHLANSRLVPDGSEHTEKEEEEEKGRGFGVINAGGGPEC